MLEFFIQTCTMVILVGLTAAGIAWIAIDTHKNLKRKYSQYTDSDVDKFMKENEGLMNDLASGEFDSVWILSYEVYIDHPTSPGFVRVREGVYTDGQKAYGDFTKLMRKCIDEPLYARQPLCERAKVIR